MAQMQKNLAIFSGSVNPEFAEKVAAELKTTLGNVKLEKFKNGEIYARYNESVRGADVFLIQSVAGEHVNDALMELLIMADAAHRASARDITAVITHYGYARQDRKAAAREPITAKLVANLIEVSGVDRVITIDLHQGQIQGFFDIPVNHLTALSIMADYFSNKDFGDKTLCVVRSIQKTVGTGIRAPVFTACEKCAFLSFWKKDLSRSSRAGANAVSGLSVTA